MDWQEKLGMPHPWKCWRLDGMGLWAVWSSGRSQPVIMREGNWKIKSLFQPKPFSDAMILWMLRSIWPDVDPSLSSTFTEKPHVQRTWSVICHLQYRYMLYPLLKVESLPISFMVFVLLCPKYLLCCLKLQAQEVQILHMQVQF